MSLDVGVQERIRRHIEELCLKAKLSGSFMKPVKTEVGRWEISLSYGTTEEMEKLEGTGDDGARETEAAEARAKGSSGPDMALGGEASSSSGSGRRRLRRTWDDRRKRWSSQGNDSVTDRDNLERCRDSALAMV